MKRNVLVLDIECFSLYDIKREFDKYVSTAKVKWIGFYSYKVNKYYELEVLGNEQLIKEFINQHNTIVSFNGLEFDVPILKNNGLWPDKYFYQIDCKVVLGTDIFHKDRGRLMGYKFKKNNLRHMAEVMGLESQKGDIDYSIFRKDVYTEQEKLEIKKYLRGDVEVTKQMFDKLFDYWLPFTSMISQKNINCWSWINCSIASLVYKYACHFMGYSEEYGDKGPKTDGGGRVIEPKVDEAYNIWYVDARSLYIHMYAMFNLLSEITEIWPDGKINPHDRKMFHGNEVFKVKGYYDISESNKLTDDLIFKLKERIRIKTEDPSNPLQFTYKNILNTFYGVNRSEVFKKVHTENSGKDCCSLGRQTNKIMEIMGDEFGYDTIYGDTDSNFWLYRNGERTWADVENDLKKIVEYINKFVPFPQETFVIEIEHFIDYVRFVKDEKKANKKNYYYVYTKRGGVKNVEVMGLPIIKSNATKLGFLILEKHLKPKMINEGIYRFDKKWVISLISGALIKDIGIMAQEYKPSAFNTYSFKGKNSLPAQISKHYFDGNSGVISLIKNKRVGKAGNAFKYCTVEESKKHNLQTHELNLNKVYNELSPFVIGGLDFKIDKHNQEGYF